MVLINAHISQPSQLMFETEGSAKGRRAYRVRRLESPRQNLTPIQLVALLTASELQGCSAIADACCWTTRNVALTTYRRATSSPIKSFAGTRPSAADKDWPLTAAAPPQKLCKQLAPHRRLRQSQWARVANAARLCSQS